MLFNTPTFLFLFLPIAFCLHWGAIPKLRNTILLSLSLWFYWWGGSSVIYILISSIVVNWSFGLIIGTIRSGKVFWLVLAVSLNLGVLAYYKYANDLLFPLVGLTSLTIKNFVIPLGISFYTFHVISYLVDIYRLSKKPFLNPINFALYICLFPQLVAGPIIRFNDIASQIENRSFDLCRISSGCERFVFGLAKKVILADHLGIVADKVFDLSKHDLTTTAAWIGVLMFALQIYFDFSGYSDMAIGLSRMFGFDLLENFNYPYFADSATDFWHRWHLSLSAWFRDYLYIPLGGNRVSKTRTYLNLLIVFVLCGLWHGANLNFVGWGVYNGLFLVFERNVSINKYVNKAFRHVYVMLFVAFGWCIFRTHSFYDCRHFVYVLLGINSGHISSEGILVLFDFKLIIITISSIVLCFPCLTFLSSDFQDRRYPNKATQLDWLPASLLRVIIERPVLLSALRAVICLGLFAIAAAQLTQGTRHSFIYFNF